jgi:hypothetical protein
VYDNRLEALLPDGVAPLEGTSTRTVPSAPRRPGEAIVLVTATDPAYGVVIVVYRFGSPTLVSPGRILLVGNDTAAGSETLIGTDKETPVGSKVLEGKDIVGRDRPVNIDDPVGRMIPVGPETSNGSDTDGSDTTGSEIDGTETDCSETLDATETSVGRDRPRGSEKRDDWRTSVGNTILVGSEKSEGREMFGGKELGNVTSDRSELSADAPVGREVMPALISDRSELKADTSDGRISDGSNEAVALGSDSNELRADTPVGRNV